jgi:hypothetical protein
MMIPYGMCRARMFCEIAIASASEAMAGLVERSRRHTKPTQNCLNIISPENALFVS